jgi:hypothetical protein
MSRNRNRHHMPERLAASVESELSRLGGEGAALEATRVWEATVGSDVARNAWPARIKRDGTLVVHARTSVWAFELTQMAEDIRMRLEPQPSAIRFVVGRVPEPAGRPPDEVSTAVLHPDSEGLKMARTLAADVASPEVREALQRAASLGLSRRSSDRPL